MTIEQLRRMHQARPFQQFVVHLADGRDLPVRSPEFMSFSPSGRTAIIHHGRDAFDIVDLLLVTSLEVQDRGEPRRRRN
jgi:hypothetical protein